MDYDPLFIYQGEHLVPYRKAFYVPFPLDWLSTSPDKACCDKPAPQPTTNRTAAAQIVRQLLYRGALLAVRQRISRSDARQDYPHNREVFMEAPSISSTKQHKRADY
ncbi:MAG: hypothetical protein IV111_13835 [Pseudomonas sp.]|nr:hypothetical protein [Pseudomonas sp.]